MGGRLDTTNVVDPALSAITPIGYDHTGFLGDKLEGIAAEKAGILKHAVPAVIGRQREVSARGDRRRGGQACRAAVPHGPRMAGDADRAPASATTATFWASTCRRRRWSARTRSTMPRRRSPASSGCAPRSSASTMRRSPRGLPRSTGRPGCRSCRAGRWSTPCRRRRAVARWRPQRGLRHRAGAHQAAEWAKEPAPLPLYLIFGMQTTKDASGFLRPLARHARAARAVPIEGHAAYTPQEACARAADVGLDCLPANDIGAALEDLSGHPARADAYPDLWLALPRGRRCWPATVERRFN